MEKGRPVNTFVRLGGEGFGLFRWTENGPSARADVIAP
jgi:hypothetical protein